MDSYVRYKKPSITNLPVDLGHEIFSQILNSSLPDRKVMRDKSNQLLASMLEARERENAFTLR